MKRFCSHIIFIFLLSVEFLNAQEFNFQTYSVTDGLAQSQVYALIQDSRGYLWMGTQGGGLCRFDGKEFTSYTIRQGLPGNFVFSIYEDFEGVLWIGTNNGLCKYDGWEFEKIEFPNGEKVNVTTIIQSPDSLIWFGTSTKGIFHYDQKEVFHYSKEKKLPIYGIYESMIDSKSNLWFSGTFGAVKIKEDIIEIYNQRKGLPGYDVLDLEEDKNGNIWFGMFDKGIYYSNEESSSLLRANNAITPTRIQSFFKDRDENIWVGTQGKGLFYWNAQDSIFTQLREKDGLSKDDVRTITQDYWGNIWLGTSGGGLSKYAGQQFSHYTKEDGLLHNRVYSVCEDTASNVWFSSSGKGVSYFDGNQFTHFENDSILGGATSKIIFQDKSARIWIGTERNGLIYRDSNQFIKLPLPNNLPGDLIRDILQDSYGNLWVASAISGITKLVPDTSQISGFAFQNFTVQQGLPSNRITNLHIDNSNRLWFATRMKGIGYIANNQVVNSFSIDEGLPSNQVKVFAEDSIGYLWIGTISGICKINTFSDSLYIDGQEDNKKLSYRNIYLLSFDRENNLWIGSQRGVEKAEFDAGRNISTTQFFDKSEGFEGIETCQNAVALSKDGSLWFGTMHGLTKHIPGSGGLNEIPPLLHISDVRLFYQSIRETEYKDWISNWGNLKKGLQLPHNKNHLGFQFEAVNIPNPDKVRYQWILEGAETEWSPPSTQNELMYPGLAPGNYTFKVKASNEDGIWTAEPKEVYFTILPPWWNTFWAKFSGGALIVFFIFGIFRLRINQIRKRAKQEQERLELENKLLSLEQKALQLQMNPHFIFNALNSIQSLISQKDNKTARYHLAKFSKLMRAILENSRAGEISLEQEIETLENYLALENFSRGNAFDYKIETTEALETEEIFIPPMMIQPFVENAILHGVGHLEEKGVIKISFDSETQLLKCVILDNGIGREKSAILNQKEQPQHQSTALQVTKERLEIFNKNGSNLFSLAYKDLKNEKEEAEGTEVTICLPII